MPLSLEQTRAIERMEIVDPAMAAVLRDKSPAERLAISHAMWRSARDMIRNLLRAEHPEWSSEEVNLATAGGFSMEHADLLRYLADTFDQMGLRYAVTGSTATIVYGEPRFTNDIDVVVDLPTARIDDFLAAFPPPGFYLSRMAVESAVAQQRQFNIIHPTSGLKVDVIVATQSEFDRQRLDRSRPLPVLTDRSVSFATPED